MLAFAIGQYGEAYGVSTGTCDEFGWRSLSLQQTLEKGDREWAS
jgi:hypothetical protein